jgi:hypothetical protein
LSFLVLCSFNFLLLCSLALFLEPFKLLQRSVDGIVDVSEVL